MPRRRQDMDSESARAHAAEVDVLTDVLRTLRLRGTAYFRADFLAPWGMEIRRRDVANFHLVVGGQCTLAVEGDDSPRVLHPGDIALLPHGATHALTSEPGVPAPPAADLLATGRASSQGRKVFGAAGPATELICGHFELDRSGGHPLIEALPQLLQLRRGDGPDPEWISTAARLAVMESDSDRRGSSAVVDRLAEALMIQLIRAHAERADLRAGFLVALSDRVLAPALDLIHRNPSKPWSVEALAQAIGASRSAFAARFKAVLQTSPMHYLTQWRMQRARELLREADLSLAEVAERVGYRSEFAFAKAFKRTFGEGPGAARRIA